MERIRIPPKQHVLLQKKRERSECSIQCAQGLRPGHATEPPPTFPFLESQCQRARRWRDLPSCQRRITARKAGPAGGVGAVYRRVVYPCQTENCRKSGNFRGSKFPTAQRQQTARAKIQTPHHRWERVKARAQHRFCCDATYARTIHRHCPPAPQKIRPPQHAEAFTLHLREGRNLASRASVKTNFGEG